MIRKHIIFHGRVQCVGFRYYARIKADELRLTGWVRNLDDGTVEMEVQGLRWKISELIRFLNEQRYIRIDFMDETQIGLQDDRDFRVRG